MSSLSSRACDTASGSAWTRRDFPRDKNRLRQSKEPWERRCPGSAATAPTVMLSCLWWHQCCSPSPHSTMGPPSEQPLVGRAEISLRSPITGLGGWRELQGRMSWALGTWCCVSNEAPRPSPELGAMEEQWPSRDKLVTGPGQSQDPCRLLVNALGQVAIGSWPISIPPGTPAGPELGCPQGHPAWLSGGLATSTAGSGSEAGAAGAVAAVGRQEGGEAVGHLLWEDAQT